MMTHDHVIYLKFQKQTNYFIGFVQGCLISYIDTLLIQLLQLLFKFPDSGFCY